MKLEFYQPERTVTGPAYSLLFKVFATILTAALAGYAVSLTLRYPLPEYGFGVKTLLLGAGLMLAIGYYWFLRSQVTIDDKGITQTWIFNRQVEWRNVSAVKLIGIPYMSWIFPPRLVVRTGNSFTTFNGGSQSVLVEFAKISLAYQMKK